MPMSDLMEDLAVPYVLVVYSVKDNDHWVRHVEYPELPGCVAEARSPLEALRRLDQLRAEIIIDMHKRGEAPPRPRPPLQSGLATGSPIDLDELLGRKSD
jgi:predicted RNase H-like HicB family nuclease